MPDRVFPHTNNAERAMLVGVTLQSDPHLLALEDSLAELGLLAQTAGLEVVGEVTQQLEHPNPKTFIGSGKLRELQMLVEETRAQVVVFDDELSPRHNRELSQALGEEVKLLDRTALILDIFAQHARTREGALQVELAQYEYRLPRLTRAWTHLARQAGGAASAGGVGLRGPGETQLEVDRRDIGRRITHLRGQIEKIRAHRRRHRSRRRRASIPTIAMVGYTNAGKSTLLNALTQANIYVADQLFATLDPTTRRVNFEDGGLALFTDTVGFIQKLPTMLVAAFRATLEEIAEADLLLHVIDATHPNNLEHAQVVEATLGELDAGDIPVLTVLNKIDRLDNDTLADVMADFPGAVPISALKQQGLEGLLSRVRRVIRDLLLPLDVCIPYTEGQLVSLFYEHGDVEHTEHLDDGIRLTGRIPHRLLAHFSPYLAEPSEADLPVYTDDVEKTV